MGVTTRFSKNVLLVAFSITIIMVPWLPLIDSKDSIFSRVTQDETIYYSHSSEYFDSRKEAIIRPHYALDSRKTTRLALMETQLITVLTDMHKKMSDKDDLCQIYLSKYISEFQQDTEAVNYNIEKRFGTSRATIVTENPILTFKMLRRILSTLMNHTINSCKDEKPEVAKSVETSFVAADLVPPTLQDLDDALVGLLTIQFIYGLNATNEMRLGLLNGIPTRAFLYFDDCLALAKKALETGAESMAYQWLAAAPQSPPEVMSPQEHLNEDMWELDQLWFKLLNMTMIGNWDTMHIKLRGKRQDKFMDYSDYEFYATCRGEVTMPIELQSELFCFYQNTWDPYFFINPVKTEVLSEEPLVIQVYEFINNEAINVIKRTSYNTMMRSGVYSEQEPQQIFSTTSMSSLIYDQEEYEPNSVLLTLNRRIERLIDLEVVEKGASNLQVVMYGAMGGHYDIHYDSLQDSKALINQYGDRIATFLMFLNDVTSGGYTAFPHIGIFAKPEIGSAILFYPTKLSGLPDKRTLHAGCPVLLGTKEVANQWILQYPNMFKHPCSVDQDE